MKTHYTKRNKQYKKDFNFGRSGESLIVEHLFKQHGLQFLGDSKSFNDNYEYYKGYDLLFHNKKNQYVKVEVKTDRHYHTGNLVIEFCCNKRKSGLQTSTAHIWIIYFPDAETDNLWMIKTKELKQYIKTHNVPVIKGGDDNGSTMLIFERTTIKHLFRIETLGKKPVKQNKVTLSNVYYSNDFKHISGYENPMDWIESNF